MTTKRSKPIKILFLLDFLRTVQAGTEKQLGYLLEHLPRRGYSITLVSMQDSPFIQDEAPNLFPAVTFMSLGVKNDITRSLSAFFRLFQMIRKEKPDIVHTYFPASNSVGILLARLAGVRVLISSRRDMGFNLSSLDIIKLRIANIFVSGVIANSKAVKERVVHMEKIDPRKIEVIYNGLDLRPFEKAREKTDKKECVVAIVANLNRPVKRVDLFIKACAIVHKEHPEVKYQIIGDGHLRKSLEKLSSDLGLSSVVDFLGRRCDVIQLLEKVTMGVISSDSEGLSNAIMEYMAMGLPVVATDVGGNAELVIDGATGWVVPSGDDFKMAQAVLRIICSPEKAVQMGQSGYHYIENFFGIEKMIEKTDCSYLKMLRQRVPLICAP